MDKSLGLIGIAPMTVDSNKNISYEDVIWVENDKSGGREYSAEPQGESFKIWAGGKPVITGNDNSGYNISLTLLDILDREIGKKMLGYSLTATGGVLEKATGKPSPMFALLIARELFNGDTLYEVDTYFQCTAARPTKNSKTYEGTFDPDFPQYDISAVPRIDNNYILTTENYDVLPTKVVVPEDPDADEGGGDDGNG
jgi:phi13 family phage major tail protein